MSITTTSDANIIEWIKRTVRSLRMKEIEFANERQYEKAIEMREKLKEVVEETLKLYPHINFKDIMGR